MAGRGAAPPPTVTALSLPGTSGNYASTPDSVANSIASDIDIRAKVAMADWTPGSDTAVLGKQGSYKLHVQSSGKLILGISSDGSTYSVPVSSVVTGFTDGTAHWIRGTWRNSDNRVQFFTSEDYDPVAVTGTWTQLGADAVASKTGIANTTNPLHIGAFITSDLLTGTVYYAEVRNGIDGTVAAKFDPSAVVIAGTRDPSTVVADTGETWTINGTGWDWATV